jgi:hypothetical protein
MIEAIRPRIPDWPNNAPAAVRSYLVVRGIAPSRLTVVSREEDNPLRDNSTQSGGAGNRRVEILVQKPQLESSP